MCLVATLDSGDAGKVTYKITIWRYAFFYVIYVFRK
jgi:hypothetical protein